MATFTENTAAAAAAAAVAPAVAMEEDDNKAPAEAAKDATKDGAATPGADGKPNDMTRCVGGRDAFVRVFLRVDLSVSISLPG